ncbi:inovirus-type Gp2 protein [Acinetobacter nematophilus]|uniref:YagK/YfjJ domain-containing protein n=1 Tax=Acinetobacter TaxID=469 RepID=UPI0012507BE0|nr:inovirus-type Gp2 protein [Acinetobacter bereziniae]
MNNQYSSINSSTLTMKIEKFVEKVIEAKYAWRDFKEEFSYLVREFDYDPLLSYSTYQKCFHDYIHHLSSLNTNNVYNCVNSIDFKAMQDFFNSYHRIKQVEINDFMRSENRNREVLIQYLDDLTQHYSKLLFIRVDLAYLTQYHQTIDIRTFKDDINKLIGYVQDQDTCFKYLEGYAWALEQGEEKGYHCHLLLIYNGAERQKDYYLANQVILRWKDITDDQGYGFNCNTSEHKQQFRERGTLGIGMIHRNNPLEVNNAINTCCYIVNPEKTNQYLRVKLPHMRTFGTGSYQRINRRYRNH